MTSTMRPRSRAVVFCVDAIGAQHDFARKMFFSNRYQHRDFRTVTETEDKHSVSQIAHPKAIPSIFPFFDMAHLVDPFAHGLIQVTPALF